MALLVVVALICASCADSRRTIPTVLPGTGVKTQIFAADGTLITEISPDQNRESVKLAEIPAIVQNAVISIEDERFWEHAGVDPKAIARAIGANSSSGATSQGGSTITQQFVKIALLSSEKTLERKIEEASLALQIERTYSKEFILEQYLNTIFLGNRSYGVQVASKSYFGHPVQQITLPEAALLAAVIQSPSSLNPYEHPERALPRRNVVLTKMAELGYITDAQRDEAINTPIQLTQTTTVDAPVQRYAAPHFIEEVKRFIRSDPAFGETADDRENLLANGGLKITTTVDLAMQAQAEQTVTEAFPRQRLPVTANGKSPDAALVSIDPRNGYVKAMVGGYDYFDTDVATHSYAQVNLAVGGGRQTGSTFKAIALAAALSNGIKMTDTFSAPGSLTLNIPGYGSWSVSGEPLGRASLTTCTIDSANTCFANLEADKRVGPQRVTDYATKMGIDTSYDPKTGYGFKTVPAEVLGANNNTVLDMTSAYGTFANRGIHVSPTLVTKVVGPSGEILYQHVPLQTKVLEAAQADSITSALEGVLTKGTASGNGIDRPSAGKTGTTQDETDAWFVGYTPDLVTGMWAGYATPIYDRQSPRGRLRKVGRTGGRLVAPVWSTYMKKALSNTPPTPFGGPAAALGEVTATTTTLKQNTAIFQPQRNPGSSTMVDLSGLTIAAATAKVRSLGLRARRVDIEVPGSLPGQVIGQSPPSGTKVLGGTDVIIESTPGTAPPPAPLPDVLNQPAAAAVPPLTKTGWVVTQTVGAAPPDLLLADGQPPASGEIWQITPAVGAVSVDGKVTVMVQP